MANIKTLYGSDKLREAYPKVNENFNELNGDINVLKTRVDTIITTPIDGEAAAQELVDARDGESSLGERIERDLQSAINESKSYTDTKVAAVASGSPKGVYTSLSDLQTAYPTGTDGIYLVTDDGKWYYWNGSAWVAGGVYQSTGIADKTIDMRKVSFIKESTNLFNRYDVIVGKVILPGTGDLSDNETYQVSGFIEVRPNETITSVKIIRITFYDSSKEYISDVNNNSPNQDTPLTTAVPNNAYYMRISTLNNYNKVAQINRGNVLLPYEEWYTPYLVDIKANDLNDEIIENKHVKNNTISVDKVDFIQRSTNIFNINIVTKGFHISSSDGSLVENPDYNSSDYIEINPSTDYSYYGFNAVAYYDSDKRFIQRIHLSYNGQTATSPSNAKYIRVHYQPKAEYYPKQINESSSLLPYEDFYSTFSEGSGLSRLNPIITEGRIDASDRYMMDVPIDGIFTTNEVYSDYTDFSNSTASDVYTMFDNLMAQYPNYITKELLGYEATGLPIYVYYLNPEFPNASVATKVPKIFLTCGVHGKEKASTLVTYLLIKQMCEKWDEYPLLEALRFNVKFIIIPVSNPWGWNNFSRTNSNGVDINRNFPHEWYQGVEGTNTYGGAAPLSELESQYIKSVFDNNNDIVIMYDFHNFHTDSNGDYFLWVPTASGVYVQHMAQNLFSRLTRKWKKEYPFIPDNYFAGYTNTAKEGMIQNYAQSIGIKFSGTFEICWRWVLDTSSVPYDQTMCKTGVEAITNWLLINLNELMR
ncbi:MAG: DUF2817 domain-containing protein [Tissierellia bacterium]|nr:DUF2817 domain-containing protein [Tissierellia bacterium]